MQDWLANLTPQYWQFWIGLVLVFIVLVGRERMAGWTAPVRSLLERVERRVTFARGPSAAARPEGQ
jgi:hypothetical protein